MKPYRIAGQVTSPARLLFLVPVMAVIAVAQTPAAPPTAAAPARPGKVATIHVQNAIVGTKEGQKAAQELDAKFASRKQALEKRQTELGNIQSQMRAGSATMSDAAKAKLQRDYDSGYKDLQRAGQDYQADVQQEEGKLMGELGGKVMQIVEKYAADHSIIMIMDVSNPQGSVLWADPSIDITSEIIKLYDQAHPATASAPAMPATKK